MKADQNNSLLPVTNLPPKRSMIELKLCELKKESSIEIDEYSQI
jgi:hypothetical protein